MDSQLNTINSHYKHDCISINGIHACFFVFCTKIRISKIVKWGYRGHFAIMILLVQSLMFVQLQNFFPEKLKTAK